MITTRQGRELGHCGIADGGAKDGPCPFCNAPRHEFGRCPSYQLRLEVAR
ncbi:hypothetical protein ACWEV3_41115 [Saccharopolyspora sp. NPDC003752]